MSGTDENRPMADRAPREEKQPQEAGQLFEGLFRRKGREPVLAVSRLRKHWPGIVGDALARVTWPARIARGVLWINAIDQGWAFNLQFVKSDLLNAARTFLGNQEIREVRYKAGPVPGVPGEAAPSDAGVAREAAAPPQETPTKSAAVADADAASAPPSVADKELPIADAKLKEFFLRAAAKLRSRRPQAVQDQKKSP